MNGLRFWAPSLSALYCVIWDVIDSSVPTAERIGGAFLGVLFLLPAFVHAHGILPREQ